MGELAGITRQSYAAIEAGASVPSTEVALRLARALGVGVEDLFQLSDGEPPGFLADAGGLGGRGSGRVRTARIGGRRVGHLLRSGAWHVGTPAEGKAREEQGDRLAVEPFAPSERPPEVDLVVAGCDPAFGLVVDHLRRERGMEVLWVPASTRAALEALGRGRVHVAGAHLQDPATGEYNGPWIRRLVPFSATRVSFAVWEQVLALAPGNPLGIRGLADLARPDIRFLNRDPGSGTRALLESRLRDEGIPEAAVPGFAETRAHGHLAVGSALAAGAADAGVTIRAVSDSMGLAALELGREPYELVVPDHFLELPAVEALLDVLRTPGLRRQVEALGGYDVETMGRTV